MSKIFVKNSATRMVKGYWRRFVAWVIALKDKYSQDLFFRTQWNIIALNVVLGVFFLTLVAYALQYLYKDIAHTILDGITSQIAEGIFDGESVIKAAQDIKSANFTIVFAATAIVAILIGYFIAKVALVPARNALSFQKRFIGNIAHELRTPLSVIKTNCEVALLDDDLDQKIRVVLKDNVGELNRASEIINNLLTFNNLVKPEQPRFEPLDLGTVVDTAIKKLARFAESQKVEISVHKSSPRMISGNKTGVEQIVTNLIKNAITYTRPGGRITVSVKPDYNGNILLVIEDTGIGIDKKDLFHILEPFYRAERSRLRRLGSSGLGLTIVSELLKLHRGKISIRSIVNKGTTVIVSLPYKPDSNSDSDIPVSAEANEVLMDYSHSYRGIRHENQNQTKAEPQTLPQKNHQTPHQNNRS